MFRFEYLRRFGVRPLCGRDKSVHPASSYLSLEPRSRGVHITLSTPLRLPASLPASSPLAPLSLSPSLLLTPQPKKRASGNNIADFYGGGESDEDEEETAFSMDAYSKGVLLSQAAEVGTHTEDGQLRPQVSVGGKVEVRRASGSGFRPRCTVEEGLCVCLRLGRSYVVCVGKAVGCFASRDVVESFFLGCFCVCLGPSALGGAWVAHGLFAGPFCSGALLCTAQTLCAKKLKCW